MRPASSNLIFPLLSMAANRRQIRETLEKPRSRAQLFKRFCAKGDACALWLISPFLSLLAGLVRPFRPQTAGWRGKRPKSQRSKAQLFGRFCALGTRRSFSLPGKTGAQRGHALGTSRVRARFKCRHKHGARLAHRRCAGKKQTGRTALQAADALQAATRVTSLPLQTALRRDGACANCPP